MTPQEAEHLLARYVAQQCSEHEENIVNSWFNEAAEKATYPDNFPMDANAMINDWDRLIAEKRKRTPILMPKRHYLIGSVAAAVIVAVIAVPFLNSFLSKKNMSPISAVMDTTIRHNDKNFKNILPDGTIVYLNGASSLRYARRLDGKQREVFLTGEAYFETARNPDRPFIVHSKEQKLQVLGTHFNIRCYEGEEVKTTVLEGAVQVSAIGGNKWQKVLNPGDQATLAVKGFEVTRVDPAGAIFWKDEFVFNQTSLKNALKELGRWYKVDIDSSRIGSETIDAVYNKKEDLKDIIQAIRTSTNVPLNLNNNRITVE